MALGTCDPLMKYCKSYVSEDKFAELKAEFEALKLATGPKGEKGEKGEAGEDGKEPRPRASPRSPSLLLKNVTSL